MSRPDRAGQLPVPAGGHRGVEVREGRGPGARPAGRARAATSSPRRSIALAPLSLPSTARAEATKGNQRSPSTASRGSVETSTRSPAARARGPTTSATVCLSWPRRPKRGVNACARYARSSARRSWGRTTRCTAADVALVDVARQALLEARRAAEARVQPLAVLGPVDGEDDVDAEVGQPVVEHVRVVVLVLREGDLQRADVGEPVERGPPGRELGRPARDEQRVVEDHRVDVQLGGSRAARCSRRSSRRSRGASRWRPARAASGAAPTASRPAPCADRARARVAACSPNASERGLPACHRRGVLTRRPERRRRPVPRIMTSASPWGVAQRDPVGEPGSADAKLRIRVAGRVERSPGRSRREPSPHARRRRARRPPTPRAPRTPRRSSGR